MIKYAVYPGTTVSRNDGQRHYITFEQLVRLYGVNPRECIDCSRPTNGFKLDGLIPLTPRYNGNYEIKGQG